MSSMVHMLITFNAFSPQVQTLNLVQPDVPFLTIAEPQRWGQPPELSEPTPPPAWSLPSIAGENFVHLVPAADITVETSTPKPLTVMESARHFTSNQVEDFMSSLSLSGEEQTVIEELTVGQTCNENWTAYRRGMITASSIHHVYTKMTSLSKGSSKDDSEPSTLINKFLGKSKFKGNVATQYGLENEATAASTYLAEESKSHSDLQLSLCGLTVLLEHSFIGASVDRKAVCSCHDTRIVEIKCPHTLKDKPDTSIETLPYVKLSEDKTYSLNKSHSYYSQVQCQMAVTQIPCAHFVIWSPHHFSVIDVTFDLDHWNALLSSATSFFLRYLGPAILKDMVCTSEGTGLVNLNTREQFLTQYTCAKPGCLKVLKDTENIMSTDDESIQCGCSCGCAQWYHIQCTDLKGNRLKNIKDTEWKCLKCSNC